mgnify:CR=1 FL=1
MAHINCRPCALRTTHDSDECVFCAHELALPPSSLDRLMPEYDEDEEDFPESPEECTDPECKWRSEKTLGTPRITKH